MMSKGRIFISILFIMGTTNAWSKNFRIDGMKFSLDVPAEWRSTEGLFEIPLTLSGPMKGDTRPVITVTPTELKKVYFNVKNHGKVNADYIEQRNKWLKKYKGKARAFDSYQDEKWSGVEAAHTLGYTFEVNDVTFMEKSYYVICKDRLYHLKYLLRDNHKEYLDETVKMVKSFRCIN